MNGLSIPVLLPLSVTFTSRIVSNMCKKIKPRPRKVNLILHSLRSVYHYHLNVFLNRYCPTAGDQSAVQCHLLFICNDSIFDPF